MTDITLRMPDDLIRKIRAYNILAGGPAQSFEKTLIGLIEKTISSEIVRAVMPEQEVAPVVSARRLMSYTDEIENIPLFRGEDASGISDGLGDESVVEEDDEDAKEAEMEDPYLSDAPRTKGKGGLTDKELEDDMALADPDHEAKAESPTVAEEDSPEALFAGVAGLPVPAVDDRAAKRGYAKRTGGRRAKVQPMTDIED